MKVNIACLVELPLRSGELPVHPELITTEGGGALESHIFELPRKILSRDEFPDGQDIDILDIVTRVEDPLLIDQVTFFASVEKPLSESWAQGEVVFVGGGDVFVGARIVSDAVDVGLATNPGGVFDGIARGVSGVKVSAGSDSVPSTTGVDLSDPMSFVSVGFGVNRSNSR